jgi:cob(I)alamin adenosyltransferase
VKIYTRTGDDGTTGLWGGVRAPKDALRIQAYGTVDECNAALGMARAVGVGSELDQLLERIQNQLFVLGADLATPGESTSIERVSTDDVAELEASIDELEGQLEVLRQFILPGGTPAAAHLHLARTICRRAERWAVGLAREEAVNGAALIYLNRLSDLLFVAARAANAQAGVPDVPWNSPRTQRRAADAAGDAG